LRNITGTSGIVLHVRLHCSKGMPPEPEFFSHIEVFGLQTNNVTGCVGGGGFTGEVGLNGGIVVGGDVGGVPEGGSGQVDGRVENVPSQQNEAPILVLFNPTQFFPVSSHKAFGPLYKTF